MFLPQISTKRAITSSTMGKTAWWKRKSSSGGDTSPPTASAVDTSCPADVTVEYVPSERNEDSSPLNTPCHQRKKSLLEPTDLGDAIKRDDAQIPSTNESEGCDEMTELVSEQEHVDECSDHPRTPSSDDAITDHQSAEEDNSNDDGDSPENKTESSEAEENQSSLGDYGAPDVEAPGIERTDTEDSGEGSVDSSAAGTQDSSADATIAMTVTSSKTNKTDYTDYTDYTTDDGILRDDEGNPVDLAEAEENMLRDNDGNIIDPKTLVMRESFLDLCCQCGEYCEDHTHAIGVDNAQDESEIDEDTYVRFTLEAIVSEMITHIEENDVGNRISETFNMQHYEQPLKEGCDKEACTQEIDEADQYQEPSEDDDNVEHTLQLDTRTTRRNTRNASGRNRSRQIRWGKTHCQQAADDTVHIMFNNTLSTLLEGAGGSIDEDSADESEDEQSRISHKSTRSEKFFKARWNYSLQVMRSEASTTQLIDARDEIDDMIRPKERVPDDRSVCSDEGTI